MVEGNAGAQRNRWLWTELFRTFGIALDPKKLVLAGAGIIAMWLGWWFLSLLFANRSEPQQSQFPVENYAKLSPEEARRQATYDFERAHERYVFHYRLAGSGEPGAAEAWKQHPGSLRIAPWDEDRGPNPFMLVTGQYRNHPRYGSIYQPGHFWEWLAVRQVPVLIEPLVKFLRPVTLMFSPLSDWVTRLYLILITLWTLVVWAFFGGAITRIAALEFAGRDTVGMFDAMRFVADRYGHYLAAPLVPLVFIFGLMIVAILFGLVHLIPGVGDLWDGLLWPIPLLLGFAQALLLVGLVGYPLMYATISAEGSDTFDALSRSYNYVYQSPWAYLWNSLVAIAYGMVVVFFVAFMGSLIVYMSKWSVGQTPGTNLQETLVSRRLDHVFMYAPNSYDWHDLLESRPELKSYAPAAVREEYLAANTGWYNRMGAFLVGLWVTLVLLAVVGFGYSYFFSASTVIYLLMRHKVDDTDLDEVYAEDDFPEDAYLPPQAPASTAASPAAPQIQMVDAPTLRTPPPEAPPPEKPA